MFPAAWVIYAQSAAAEAHSSFKQKARCACDRKRDRFDTGPAANAQLEADCDAAKARYDELVLSRALAICYSFLAHTRGRLLAPSNI
jgi:hypothetical protein